MYDNETWEQYESERKARRDAEIESEYDAFIDALGDDEAIAEITADWVVEPAYFVESVKVDSITANISTNNTPKGKFIIMLDGVADGWMGYADTIEEARQTARELIEEYEAYEA